MQTRVWQARQINLTIWYNKSYFVYNLWQPLKFSLFLASGLILWQLAAFLLVGLLETKVIHFVATTHILANRFSGNQGNIFVVINNILDSRFFWKPS